MRQIKKGFTIIELMLAMTIVSLLLMAIGTMTMQMISLITKGNTMRELNTAGRAINDDFTRSFNSVSMIDQIRESGDVRADGTVNFIQLSDDAGGVFCTGAVSYLWNGARTINSNSELPFRYEGVGPQNIRLVRVDDRDKNYCRDRANWGRIPRNGNVREVLSASENGLMVYRMSFSRLSNDTASNQSLINIEYVLGTKSDEGQIMSVGSGPDAQQCRPGHEMQEYCAINRFNLTVRTLGE